MKNIDEATLIDLAVNSNDQRAFAELVNRHQSKLRYSLRQLFLNSFTNLSSNRSFRAGYTE